MWKRRKRGREKNDSREEFDWFEQMKWIILSTVLSVRDFLFPSDLNLLEYYQIIFLILIVASKFQSFWWIREKAAAYPFSISIKFHNFPCITIQCLCLFRLQLPHTNHIRYQKPSIQNKKIMMNKNEDRRIRKSR